MKERKFTVQPDVPDLRDRMYHPTLRGLRATFNSQPFADPASFARVKHQGQTSACTGFALAGMIEGLVYGAWRRSDQESTAPAAISPFMLYYFARRYDELPGDDPEAGSTARGAMKAWHKHGACKEPLWPKAETSIKKDGAEWISDAFRTPLGAYFRVDHTSIPDMHAAINETGFVYVTAQIHSGWSEPHADTGAIDFDNTQQPLGGHAFLLVGYDEDGFWLQNSWGDEWGRKGFARLSYSDWRGNSMDAWVAQLGVQISHKAEHLGFGLPYAPASSGTEGPASNLSSNANLSAQQINPYIINLGNNGTLSDTGQFATKAEDLRDLLAHYLPNALTAWKLSDTQPIDVAIYAHGGLTDEAGAAETARWWVPALFNQKVFPIFLMWETGFWDVVYDIVADAFGAQSKGGAASGFWDKIANKAEDFWNERLENIASVPGTIQWDEMKENGERATMNKDGGLHALYRELLKPEHDAIRSRLRFHLIGHSAGSIVHAHLGAALVGAKLTVDGIYFLAPACRIGLFTEKLLPLYASGKIASYTQFHLTDEVERRDDCFKIYRQSLLYLVSNAFEHQRGTPILGMQKFSGALVGGKPPSVAVWDWVASPTSPADPALRSNSTTHGGFDNDSDTRAAVLARIARRMGPNGAKAKAPKEKGKAPKVAKGSKAASAAGMFRLAAGAPPLTPSDVLDIVLEELERQTLFLDPKPTSNTSKWFALIEEIDKKSGKKTTRNDDFLDALRHRLPKFTLGKAQLIVPDDFPTPRHLANVIA